MGDKAISIEEQITTLKTRGLIIQNEDKAKEILKDIGYYRLGFYWYYFQEDKIRHVFKEGTQFSTAVDLYYFDMDLRHLLTKVLSRIEVNLRTQITYIVSNHYSENPIWFADTNIIDSEFVKTIKKIYKDIRKNNTIIQNHHTRYEVPYAPAWKTLEFVTLGSIRKIFNAIKDDSVKMKIIEVYGINRIDIFDNYLKAIVDIRNACSHTRVIFDFRSEETIKNTKICKILPSERNHLNAIIKVIHYFLTKISNNRANDMKKEIDDLILKHTSNKDLIDIIKEKMKYSL